jgi:hypothetical protein
MFYASHWAQVGEGSFINSAGRWGGRSAIFLIGKTATSIASSTIDLRTRILRCTRWVSRGTGAKPWTGGTLIAGRKQESRKARQLTSIVQFERAGIDVAAKKKKDVKPIVDVVISSNAEQNKNSFF